MRRMTLFVLSIVVLYVSIGYTANIDNSFPENIRHLVRENAVEEISKRGKYTKIFNNGDGTFRVVISNVPMHYKDVNEEWKDIENLNGLMKMADIPYEELISYRANPEYHLYTNPANYTQQCNDWKVGVTISSDTTTSRLIPEWDLSEVETPVATVTNATVSFDPDDLNELNLFICGSITIQPSDTLSYSHGDRYNSVNSNFLIDTVCLDNATVVSDLDSEEMDTIKDRCGDENWYAVGYRLSSESLGNYNKLINHYLAFDYTCARKIALKPEPIDTSVSVVPNPFNPKTTITYHLEYTSNVKLDIYGLNGQKAAQLVNEPKRSGTHEVTFDGTGLSSGLYIYRFRSSQFNTTGKMMLVK
ncbi:T9SS type A sorting domain-containing protein [Candidatus Latescibacterota bacterium]